VRKGIIKYKTETREKRKKVSLSFEMVVGLVFLLPFVFKTLMPLDRNP
jgi:hypothetical protein